LDPKINHLGHKSPSNPLEHIASLFSPSHIYAHGPSTIYCIDIPLPAPVPHKTSLTCWRQSANKHIRTSQKSRIWIVTSWLKHLYNGFMQQICHLLQWLTVESRAE